MSSICESSVTENIDPKGRKLRFSRWNFEGTLNWMCVPEGISVGVCCKDKISCGYQIYFNICPPILKFFPNTTDFLKVSSIGTSLWKRFDHIFSNFSSNRPPTFWQQWVLTIRLACFRASRPCEKCFLYRRHRALEAHFSDGFVRISSNHSSKIWQE